jgi:hypothetical protein
MRIRGSEKAADGAHSPPGKQPNVASSRRQSQNSVAARFRHDPARWQKTGAGGAAWVARHDRRIAAGTELRHRRRGAYRARRAQLLGRGGRLALAARAVRGRQVVAAGAAGAGGAAERRPAHAAGHRYRRGETARSAGAAPAHRRGLSGLSAARPSQRVRQRRPAAASGGPARGYHAHRCLRAAALGRAGALCRGCRAASSSAPRWRGR